MNKTYSAKPADVKRSWYLIDAKDASLGRISTAAAKLLLGKDKPIFSHHIDCGDFVVIINASELVVSGNKLLTKRYYSHSHYPGGLHSRTLKEQLDKDPSKVLVSSIKGMLPANKLQNDRLKRLKVYKGSEHKHEAQQPLILSLKKDGTK